MRLGGGAANAVPSPPPTRAARGGGLSPRSAARSETAEPPPSPDPHPPLRGRRGADRARGEAALNSTSVGKNPAKVLPAPVGAIRSVERSSRAFANSAN